jgi:DNA-binding NarL/FixJ family response regulator
MPGAIITGRELRVLVVDDHAIMREGLSALLDSEPDLSVVGTAADGKAAIEATCELRPDVVITDLSMPRTDGVSAIEAIKRRHPETRIVVLSYHMDDKHVHAALEAGADAYVLKDDGRSEVLEAIRSVAEGNGYLSPAICRRVMNLFVQTGNATDNMESTSWDLLSSREREVLKLVAEGYKTREIANYLGLSAKTVEKHRANMMRKMNLHSIADVTAYAIDNGLLSH